MMALREPEEARTRVGIVVVSRLEPELIERLKSLISSLGEPERTWFYPIGIGNQTYVVYGVLINTERRLDEVASKVDEFTRANSAKALIFSPWEFILESEL